MIFFFSLREEFFVYTQTAERRESGENLRLGSSLLITAHTLEANFNSFLHRNFWHLARWRYAALHTVFFIVYWNTYAVCVCMRACVRKCRSRIYCSEMATFARLTFAVWQYVRLRVCVCVSWRIRYSLMEFVFVTLKILIRIESKMKIVFFDFLIWFCHVFRTARDEVRISIAYHFDTEKAAICGNVRKMENPK